MLTTEEHYYGNEIDLSNRSSMKNKTSTQVLHTTTNNLNYFYSGISCHPQTRGVKYVNQIPILVFFDNCTLGGTFETDEFHKGKAYIGNTTRCHSSTNFINFDIIQFDESILELPKNLIGEVEKRLRTVNKCLKCRRNISEDIKLVSTRRFYCYKCKSYYHFNCMERIRSELDDSNYKPDRCKECYNIKLQDK